MTLIAIDYDIEPISKCFAFLKLAFEYANF